MSNSYCPECKADRFEECTGRTDEPCPSCGRVNRNSCPIWESGQHAYCSGCAGYPFCSCTVRHTGECSPETRDHMGHPAARLQSDLFAGASS